MMYRSLALALTLAACSGSELTAAVGLQVGDGPHQGVIQQARGTKVELVPMKDGSLRAYMTDEKGTPITAAGEVRATISAPSFAPTEVLLVPAEDGAYFSGRLPAAPPSVPADITLAFPQGVSLSYPGVPLVAAAAVGPVAVAAAPVVPAGVPSGFAPPHKGTVTRVGDNLVEVVIAPKGEVRAYAYTLDGTPIPVGEVQIPAIEIGYKGKPYKVKLKAAPDSAYLTGKIDAKVTIPARAEITVVCPEPITIYGVVYEPSIVVFPALVVVEAIVITPVVIEVHHHSHKKHHKHHKHHKHRH